MVGPATARHAGWVYNTGSAEVLAILLPYIQRDALLYFTTRDLLQVGLEGIPTEIKTVHSLFCEHLSYNIHLYSDQIVGCDYSWLDICYRQLVIINCVQRTVLLWSSLFFVVLGCYFFTKTGLSSQDFLANIVTKKQHLFSSKWNSWTRSKIHLTMFGLSEYNLWKLAGLARMCIFSRCADLGDQDQHQECDCAVTMPACVCNMVPTQEHFLTTQDIMGLYSAQENRNILAPIYFNFTCKALTCNQSFVS